MAIPLLGDLGTLQRGFEDQQASQRYMADSLSNLGARIGESINQRKMQEEAQNTAPLMFQQYQNAYSDIMNGDPGTGMAKLATLGQGTSNPILMRQNEQAFRAGAQLTNDFFAQQRQAIGIDASMQRDDINNAAARERAQLRGGNQPPGVRPMTGSQTLYARVNFRSEVDPIIAAMEAAQSEEEYAKASRLFDDAVSTYQQAGATIPPVEKPPYISPEDRKKLRENEKLNKDQAGKSRFMGLGSYDSDIKKREEENEEIRKRAKSSPASTTSGNLKPGLYKKPGSNEEYRVMPDGTIVKVK